MKKTTFGILLFLIICSLGWNFYNTFNLPKIAFVRSQDLVYKYAGMLEMQNKFSTKTEVWKANIDSLTLDYNRTLNTLNDNAKNISELESQKLYEKLLVQKQNVEQYSSVIQEKKSKEESEMLEQVFNQINSFVKQYSKKHNYTVVFGTTLDGNILYGEESIDITEEVLKALNESY